MISSVDLAGLLGIHAPTAQQQVVIEAPLTPALVVAGAGSGKTDTMASRVVWLVANNLTTPDQILGLTFTRKAAGSLSKRVSERIAILRDVQDRHPERFTATPETGSIEFDQPTISTYNSFASALFSENALLIGREPESTLLNDPSSWQLARKLVVASTDERLIGLEKSITALTEAVLAISHALSDNVAHAADVAAYAARFTQLSELPFAETAHKKTPYVSVIEAVSEVGSLAPLLDLAVQYAQQKRQQGLLEFSDQVALALEVSERSSDVVEHYQDRYRVVLLDEYQDTSVVQTRLLARLFGNHAVMAVGDPHQSIYGWRGASAANLARFSRDFSGTDDAQIFALSTSWRNATSVLDAANVIVEPLSARSPVRVESLDARPDSPAGTIDAHYFEHIDEEAHGVAKWFAGALAPPAWNHYDPDPEVAAPTPPTAAILFRRRSDMDRFAAALATEEVPYHVLGIGGLLSTPEIVDLVSALTVIHDPTAGSELIRLLAGARWSIGPRDLAELASLSRWLLSRSVTQQELSAEVRQRMRESVAVDDSASIVDALDFVGEAPATHSQLQGFSDEGILRLKDAAAQLAFFRSRAGLELGDLVRLLEQELLLDIEVVASRPQAQGMANLYAFHDELAGFLASDDQATLGSFLSWLRRAAQQDMMGPRSDDAEAGTVQLLTIHASKGLEWDLVALPRLVAGEIPATSREGKGWVGFGKLPFAFRGDSAELPEVAWENANYQSEFDASLKDFKVALADRHQAEERRLGYVAITRARDNLLLSGSFWSSRSKPQAPSVFLQELQERGLIEELPTDPVNEENPTLNDLVDPLWPFDPLGHRRATVETAAQSVNTADPGGEGLWSREIDLLLAERDQAASDATRTPLPQRIPASRFKDYIADPEAVALSLRRPMPEKPYRATRLGTQFHEWVETRFGGSASADTFDALPLEIDGTDADSVADAEQLARLQATFERSSWATRKPVDVEIEIHVPFDDRVVICKIDAVYADGDRYEIVDWKTGRAPRDAADLEAKQLQLALYRLAYAQFRGIAPENIDAAFYFVADDTVIRPEHLYGESELRAAWARSVGTAPSFSA
ncbi:DNA helicase-2/ATP-dependent DNA helicase PcrA [Rhodoglobus vestalii]|uniref:DNA 3'-5' helicase n=1 Tax=Rhodoglobus vestalii TaxID=193384 RepID=A0A8H2K9I4_9MICO|nr:ATP-dependent DNA helicase [Rhodoglobus vestalii]TQO19186.1 DNA helicase-2/ATP-dependent DNA helicase PcrA [Rhodoglobus vestalii]